MIFCFEFFLRGVPHFLGFWKSKVLTPLAGHASESEICERHPDHVLPRQSPGQRPRGACAWLIGEWRRKRGVRKREEKRGERKKRGKAKKVVGAEDSLLPPILNLSNAA